MARAATVPVAEPTPVDGRRPEPIASMKPRPVRTVVLPQLPEPSTPTAKTPAPIMNEHVPEAFASLLPVPDETPIRVEPQATPKRYEAPALRPEAFTAGLKAAPTGAVIPLAMAEPLPVSHARALAYVMTAPGRLDPASKVVLSDPSLPSSQQAVALARMVPPMENSGTVAELAWPEIEADGIPEVAMALLVAPLPTIPATSLAEGEIVLPSSEGPAALALETPVFGAAETVVALEEAQVEPDETPVALAEGGLPIPASAAPTGLQEAAEQKPETAPYVESPREYIVAIEPTSPKPPAATTPAATTPAPVTGKPAVTAAPVAPVTAAPAAPTGTLQKGLYYIQIGAYRNESAAKDASVRIGSSFAVLIERIGDKGKETWRVYVGPLSRDESGVALVRVRSMGYKDAFVKSGG
ncbi:MAG: hypothetical protein CVV51_11995 [Spirochaetae bacterium HGW-Spirochaetae-7]|nr:MAG: hypothetical protein CVV51_11995 [Spirochaetae bacterium HGW-Spirochaetae-7]